MWYQQEQMNLVWEKCHATSIIYRDVYSKDHQANTIKTDALEYSFIITRHLFNSCHTEVKLKLAQTPTFN